MTASVLAGGLGLERGRGGRQGAPREANFGVMEMFYGVILMRVIGLHAVVK